MAKRSTKSDPPKGKKKAIVFAEYKPLGDEGRDSSFVKEAESLKRFYDRTDPNTEVIIKPFYGEEEFNEARKSLKGTTKDDKVFLFGHSGSRLGGVKHEEIAGYLEDANVDDCYLGSCSMKDYSKPYKKLKNLKYREDGPWYGVNEKSDDLVDAMYSKAWTGNPNDFYGADVVKPEEGIHYSKSFNRIPEVAIDTIERDMNKSKKKADPLYSYNLPQYGLGAFLKSAEGKSDSIASVGGGLAALSTIGKPNGFKGFIGGAGSGAAMGAKLGSVIPGLGTAIGTIGGGLVGGILGMGKGKKAKEELEAENNQRLLAERRNQENEARSEMQRSQGVLNQYPTEGVQGVNLFGKTYGKGGTVKKHKRLSIPNYALGGSPDYLAEGDEVIEYDQMNPPMVHGNGEIDPLSSSLGSIQGQSHSGPDGGVPMSGGERIYSDRLKPSQELKNYLKSEKINTKGTYADIIARVGKKEGKNEKALFSDDRFEKTRATKMNEKYSLAKELIFADQEANKPVEDEVVDLTGSQEEFSYGGNLPKHAFGTEFTKGLNKAWGSGAKKVLDSFGTASQSVAPETGGGFGSTIGKIGGFLNDNMDMIASGASYALNDRSINQMPLTQETRMFNPVYMDETREDGLQQSRIQSQTRQGMRTNAAGSSQTRNAVIGDLVSRATNASNQVSDAENRRITQVRNQNAATANNAGMYNTQLTNQAYGDYQANRMLQLGEKMKNRNNLTQSILGNLQVRKMNEMDKERMRLIAERDKERGIIGRSDTFKDFLDSYLNKG